MIDLIIELYFLGVFSTILFITLHNFLEGIVAQELAIIKVTSCKVICIMVGSYVGLMVLVYILIRSDGTTIE